MASEGKTLVLFDGHCNTCNWFVDFLLRHDREQRFYFSSLQSATAERFLAEHQVPAVDSVVLIDDDKVYLHSSAVFRILRYLPWPWPNLSWLAIFPRSLTDSLYRTFARNRYRWFGRRETCRVPTAQERARFI